ncbi:MAG: hypothetical protein ACPHAS_05555 [Synechococcus sp.]
MSNRLNYLYLMNKASEASDPTTYDFYLKRANQEKLKEISKRSLQSSSTIGRSSN